jgi:hypothetical protein
MPLADATTDWAVAQVQAKVGQFLGLKAQLQTLQGVADPAVQAQANTLMTQQLNLEGQLGDVQGAVARLTSGSITLTDSAAVVAFGYAMMKQIDDVNRLSAQAAGQATTPNWSMLLVVGGLGYLAYRWWGK